MASNQPGGRRQGQYRGHTASTGAPDKQTQKGRNRKADPEGQKHRKAFPLSCKGGSREGAPASRESCCTLIFSGGGFYLGATSSGLEMLRPQSTENNMSIVRLLNIFHGVGSCLQVQPVPGRPEVLVVDALYFLDWCSTVAVW